MSADRRRTSSANAAPFRRSNRPKIDNLIEDHPALAEEILTIVTDEDISNVAASKTITAMISPDKISNAAIATWRSANGVGIYRASQASRNERRAAERNAESTAGDFEYDVANGEGHITVVTEGDAKVGNLDELLAFHGLDPERVRIVGDARISRWTTSRWNKETDEVEVIWNTSHRFRIDSIRNGEFDLPSAFATARARTFDRVPERPDIRRTGVVVLGDLQIGKAQESRGGTPELLERVYSIRDQIDAHIATRQLSHGLLIDVGDIIEGDQSAGALKGLVTNDLSPMEQVDLATTISWDFAATLLDNAPSVTATSVPSNHAAYRRGGDQLGKPSDDWGIFVTKQLARLASISSVSDRFNIALPDEHEESIRIDVYGHGVGVVHGHRHRPNGFEKWVGGQSANRGPITGSEVIVTGHYHHLVVEPAGVSDSGRHAWHIQAPSADGGSGWFRQSTGATAQPGIVYFEMTASGFDLSSVRLFSAPWETTVPKRLVHQIG